MYKHFWPNFSRHISIILKFKKFELINYLRSRQISFLVERHLLRFFLSRLEPRKIYLDELGIYLFHTFCDQQFEIKTNDLFPNIWKCFQNFKLWYTFRKIDKLINYLKTYIQISRGECGGLRAGESTTCASDFCPWKSTFILVKICLCAFKFNSWKDRLKFGGNLSNFRSERSGQVLAIFSSVARENPLILRNCFVCVWGFWAFCT